MAVKLRLKRVGRSKRPFYRLVAIDSRSRRDGAEIERLGWYDPLRLDASVKIDEDRVIHWISNGAQPTETVNNILKEVGLKYKIHLMSEGKDEKTILSMFEEWQKNQQEKRTKSLDKKAKKKQDELKSREVPEDEISVQNSTDEAVESKSDSGDSIAKDDAEGTEPTDEAVESKSDSGDADKKNEMSQSDLESKEKKD